MKKQVFIKTYDTTGGFKGLFNDFVFSSFTSSLNGGLGDLSVTIPRRFDEYNTDRAIVSGYKLEVYISDTENVSGLKIYEGTIDSINIKVGGDGEQVAISCSGYIWQLATDLLEYSSSTIYKKYTTTDISAIIKDIIDNYQARRSDDEVTYDVGATTIDTSGKSLTLEVFMESPLTAIAHAASQADADWYWRVGRDSNFYFKEMSTTADHMFVFGRDVIELEGNENIRDVKTGILITNGLASTDSDSIMKMYTSTSGEANYGRRYEKKRDGRYKATAGTADEYGARFLDIYSEPIKTVRLRILDSNLPGGGYDIESIEPGDTCKILNIEEDVTDSTLWGYFNWGEADWGASEDAGVLTNNMLITSVEYNIDYVDITLNDKISYVNRELLERKKENAAVAYTDNQDRTYTT